MAATAGESPGARAPIAQLPAAVAATRLSIDRLTLHVPAMSEADARLLAEQVGEALRDWPTVPAASGRIGRLDAQVTAPPPASSGSAMAGSAAGAGAGAAAGTGDMARRIAAAILEAALREVR
jgi:hypothetical protein